MSNMTIYVKNRFKNYVVNYRKIFIWEKKKNPEPNGPEYVYSYSRQIKPSREPHPISFLEGPEEDKVYAVKIFPNYTPSKLPAWPDAYWITLNGDIWKYCVDIIDSNCLSLPTCNEIDHEKEYLLKFQAPSEFPCPEYDEDNKRLIIRPQDPEVLVPPMWWVEILPPTKAELAPRVVDPDNTNIEIGDDSE